MMKVIEAIGHQAKDNPFTPLAEMLPDERFNQVAELFDKAMTREAGEEDGWKLGGLAVLLYCLENHPSDPEFDKTSLAIPLLCKMQALQAAYDLGRKSKREASDAQ